MKANAKMNLSLNENNEKKLVFVVEDDISSFRLIRELLMVIDDVEIIHAINGEEAFERFQNLEQVDLVLLDIRLPGIDGLTLAGLFKQLKPSVPIIAQTAYGMIEDYQKCIDAGCDNYLKKPIDIEDFYHKLGGYLPIKNPLEL